jgi:uncharacterized Zn finger protein
MAGWWSYEEWTRPRKADGIRAQSQRGRFGQTWWAGRWIAALERLVDPGRLSRGRSYARNGQVLTLDVTSEGVTSQVQGSRPRPYSVSIGFRHLSESESDRVIATMAGEAIYAAKLLAGEMPAEIESVFQVAGVALFPASDNDLTTSCSCPDWSNPCKHVAAVHYLLGERFDTDPFLIFLLRGKSGDGVATALRVLRVGSNVDIAVAAEHEDGDEESVPLFAGSAERFWRPPDDAPLPAVTFEAPEVEAVAVKRLGEPAFAPDPVQMVEEFERMYGTIGAYARRLALGED